MSTKSFDYVLYSYAIDYAMLSVPSKFYNPLPHKIRSPQQTLSKIFNLPKLKGRVHAMYTYIKNIDNDVSHREIFTISKILAICKIYALILCFF